MPIYQSLAKSIAEKISSGEWPTGTVLPSETALAAEWRVSVGTMRRALSELTSEGLLARRRKTGTVVTGRPPRQNLRFYFQYFRLHGRDGTLQNSLTKVLHAVGRPATPAEATKLAIEVGGAVIEIHRLRIVKGRRVMHETLVIAAGLVPGIDLAPEAIPERLYSALWEVWGQKIAAIREEISAEVATPEDCRLLDLAPPAAVLVISEIAYDEQARPLLLNCHRANTAQDVYINEIQ
ncbi:GntR family transcriptional regulator [Falsirhodobacter algicola]|nr:GntR family transcriptional regulator [Falsirhodobacter algicola]